MMTKQLRGMSFLFGIHCAVAAASAELRLPALLSDHAMLQAGRPVCVWGSADANTEVSATWSGATARTLADASGRWTLWLPAVKAGSVGELVVKSGTETRTVHDVLAGEVWLASGQSNMERSLHYSQNREAVEARAVQTHLRFFVVGHRDADQPADDVTGHWEIAGAKSIDMFSATAASFAIELADRRKTPVGIVESAYGGTRLLAWTSDAVLHADGRLQWVLDDWAKTLAAYPPKKAAWDEAMQRWLATLTPADRAKAEKGAPLNGRPAEPLGPGSKAQPAGLYNGMVAPLTKYTVRGILWYQGENDATDDLSTYRYRDLFQAMILSWRHAFGDETLPFVFVQVSRYHWPAYALMRESQAKALNLAHTAMVVSVDQGMYEDVHYPDKEVIGQRLERAVEELAYGVRGAYTPLQPARLTQDTAGLRLWFATEDAAPQMHTPQIPYFAPATPANATAPHVVDDRVVLERQPTGEELQTAAQIAGSDGVFSPAKIVVDGNTVVFSSPSVPQPTQVCYAWRDGAPALVLWSSSGLPVTPFRMALDPSVEPRCPATPAWKPAP